MSSSPYRALRWTPSGSTYPTVEYLPDAGKGSLAYAIASDGTIAGVFPGSPERAVMWSAFGGYTLLGYAGNGTAGEAYDVVVKDGGGLLLAGYQTSGQALRWKAGF